MISLPLLFILFFFFKQKTAYEIKECDWSSDVCSSDLDVVMTTSSYFDPDNDNHIHVFLQNASGSLEPPVKYPINCDCYAYHPRSIDIGDLNNDGRADVVVDVENGIGVFYQNSSGGLDTILS